MQAEVIWMGYKRAIPTSRAS